MIPYSTDAPVYHFPIGTIGLILVNTYLFFTTTATAQSAADVEAFSHLLLQFDTISPAQWVTGAFMHADFEHLLGNMFFLWCFGLIIEGKLGWLFFVPLYLLLAALDGAAVQVPMYLLSPDGAALGASGVIYAMMAIAIIWAPENEISFLLWIGLYVRTFDLRVVVLGALYVGLEILMLYLGGFRMSSELLHLVGLIIGIPVGILMLKLKWVDCEGWDLFSRWSR